MVNDEPEFIQGDTVWAQYPLTGKIDKLKRRPVLVISNGRSNGLDNDYIAVPITKMIRQEPFSLTIEPIDVNGELPVSSELRCNKPFTVRRTLLYDKIGTLTETKIEQAIRLTIESVDYQPNLKKNSAQGAQF